MRNSLHISFLLLPVSLLVALCSCGDALRELPPDLQADQPGRWLELPATDTPGLCFIHHAMPGQPELRNYSLYLDPDARVSVWVAYPLNAGLTGNGRRPDPEPWGLDPKVPEAYQANMVLRGFSGSAGYDRGHQVASADRYAFDSNAETYYGTNITPQLHDFNGGVWNTLEGMVRSWSRHCDTLYVVSGAVLRDSPGTVPDNTGKRIAIPSAYYKALLAYRREGGFGREAGEYIGAAFFFEHRNWPNSRAEVRAHAMSLDALEARLGFDLFVNLPPDTARRVEAQDPLSVGWWWDN